MAYEEVLKCISLRCPTTTYSGYQYHGVMASSSEGYFKIGTTASTAGAHEWVGILQDSPTVAGETCRIGISGVSKIVVGTASLASGKRFLSGPTGVAISTASAVAYDIIYGPVITDAAASTSSVASVLMKKVGITT